jgi:hypothetical protein
MSVQVCSGCQGRNLPQAEICEWCGRHFDGRAGGFSLRWWHLATALLFGFVLLAAISMVFLSNVRLPSMNELRARAPVSPVPAAAATTLPTRAATPALTLATPRPSGSPGAAAIAAPTPVPPPSPTAAPARYVRIANTNGLGVFLREEPGPQSQRITPAVAEGALLRLVGPEQTVQAQIWRLCEHEGRAIQGWVPAQYIQPAETVPTPARP